VNPINILTKEEQCDYLQKEKDKTTVKGRRVENYMSSSLFKDAITNTKVSNTAIQSDKIVNTEAKNISDSIKNSEPKQYIKNFKHAYDEEKKRAFYPSK
jgi:hypothetical protein